MTKLMEAMNAIQFFLFYKTASILFFSFLIDKYLVLNWDWYILVAYL